MARGIPGPRHRAAVPALPRRWRRRSRDRACSCGLQIGLERLDRYFQACGRIGSPQLLAVEDDGVKPLRVLALAEHDRIRIDVTAADRLDHADAVARIARQARMRSRVDVLRAYLVAGFEASRRSLFAVVRPALHRIVDLGGNELALDRLRGMERMPGLQFVLAHQAEGEETRFKAAMPFLVIGDAEIDMRRQLLDRSATDIDVPIAEEAGDALHGEDAAFPIGVKDGLVLLGRHRAKAMHPAHVMDAIHCDVLLCVGCSGSPVPTMESRVTSSASCSSSQPSVPAGRCGMTMKRVSAVESQTRISASVGRVTPKSFKTPRGSTTERER